MKRITRSLTTALAAAVIVCAAAQTHAQDGWPGQEEVQSIAWTNPKAGPPWPSDNFTGQAALIRMTDIQMPVWRDGYYSGKTGVTNFQGITFEAGTIKFCTGVRPEWCALRPYAASLNAGIYQRNIDTVLYSYYIEPDQDISSFRAVWRGSQRLLILQRFASPLSGFPNVFTAAASTEPYWLTAQMGFPTALMNGTGFQRAWCFTGTANRNQIALISPGMPAVSACTNATSPIWQHNFAKSSVYSPAVTR